MAATLSITYTPNYQGCHRICFRTSEENYCCYLDTSGVVIGTPKTITINLTEDFSDCLVTTPSEYGCEGNVNLQGYVQACCVNANSIEDRIPFSASYSSIACESYTVQCLESGVDALVVNGGYGWPVGVIPTVTLLNTGPSGNDWDAVVTMTCPPGENFCFIDDISVNNPGENYFTTVGLSIDVTPLPSCISNELVTNGNFATDLSGWAPFPIPNRWQWQPGGSARYNNVTYAGFVPGGRLTQNILTPGKTYDININTVALGCTSGNVDLIITAGTFDVSGTNPNQYLLSVPAGPTNTTPISITLTCTGNSEFSVYAFASIGANSPTDIIEISDISVVETCIAELPEFTFLLDECPSFVIPDCAGNPTGAVYELRGGSLSLNTINVCSGGVGPTGNKYFISPNPTGDCCNCFLYNVLVTDPMDIYYTSCNNQVVELVSVQPGPIGVTVCASENSVWPVNKEDNDKIVVINDVGICERNP